MTETGSINGLFTNRISLGVGDIETGCSSWHVTDIERNHKPLNAPSEKMADGGSNHEQVGDIEKWAGSLAKLLEDVPQHMCNPGHPGRITRIPQNLHEVDVKAYEPYFLSIGPYHHGRPMVKSMEMKKQAILKCFLEQDSDITLKDYLKEIKNIEHVARSFYSDVQMESKEFVFMLLLDCIVILAQFCGIPRRRKRVNQTKTGALNRVDVRAGDESEIVIAQDKKAGVGNEKKEMILSADEPNNETNCDENFADPPAWFLTLFMHDIFLLENQLPFVVLQKVYNIAYGGSKMQLLRIVKYQIGVMLAEYTKLDSDMVISPSEEVHHLLHLCHMLFRPKLNQNSATLRLTNSNRSFRLGSAVQLYEAGVSFETRSSSTQHSLLDITFGSSGKMVMPCLHVDDNTNSILRNLIALEQMKYPSLGLDVSAYAVLLLHLVTTPEDANLLRRKGIIQHHLASDKEMMYFVNRLSVGLAFDYEEDIYGLKPVFQELKCYTERKVPRWRAGLKHRYFSNPWTVISLLAASLLLLLSVVQTFFTVYSYYR